MTYQELENIAVQIRTNKQNYSINSDTFINALSCYRRTPGNVAYIDGFLRNNKIDTVPRYTESRGLIDLIYKPENKSSDNKFKLSYLHINLYKNLKNIVIDFENTDNYCAFIGLNGSGKSNVLEAISEIFYTLYHIATLENTKSANCKCSFSYTICYWLGEKHYCFKDGKLNTKEKINTTMLPTNLIASYSGEDVRLWGKYYKPIYERYCGKLTAQAGFVPPFLFYINREQWEIAMVSLLYSEDIDVVSFIAKMLGDRKCTIVFEFNSKNSHKWTGTLTEAFIEELKKKTTYSVQEFRNTIDNISFINQSSTLFYLLYGSTTNDEYKLISKIDIQFDDGSSLDGLSEGEKRMILSNAIIHILATNNSLCLFDEPDSHVHISRKSELIKLIDSDIRYSVLTTHSPIFLGKMNPNNIRFVENGEIRPIDKLKQFIDLTNGEFNYMEGAFILSSKYSVVVEGTDDIKYIKKAIEVLSQKDPKYKKLEQIAFIPQGSAGHTRSFFNDIIIDQLPICSSILYIFDYDQAGVDGWNKIEDYKSTHSKLNNIFYQEDYTTIYDAAIKNPQTPFFVEDLFHEEAYKSIVGCLPSVMKFKEFKSRSNLHKTIKDHIEKHYATFDKGHYDGFIPLLNKMIEIFSF